MACTPQQIVDDARRMFERELDAFVPDRVFDAHFEIWDEQATIKDSVGVTIPTRFEDVKPGLRAMGSSRAPAGKCKRYDRSGKTFAFACSRPGS